MLHLAPADVVVRPVEVDVQGCRDIIRYMGEVGVDDAGPDELLQIMIGIHQLFNGPEAAEIIIQHWGVMPDQDYIPSLHAQEAQNCQ